MKFVVRVALLGLCSGVIYSGHVIAKTKTKQEKMGIVEVGGKGEIATTSKAPKTVGVKLYKQDFEPVLGITFYEKIVLATKAPLYIDITTEERYTTNKCSWRELMRKYGKKIDANYSAKLYVGWIDDHVGYGCFADQVIKAGEMIEAYTGVLGRNKCISGDRDFVFAYPSLAKEKDGTSSDLVINSKTGGNFTRFINSSTTSPNAVCRYIPRNGLWHPVYIALRDIQKDTQVLANYGAAFWATRGTQEVNLAQ